MARTILKKFLSKEVPEGAGARVRRSVGGHELRNLDPFLLLDEAEVQLPAGFPDHPHRGFETVSYVLEGCGQHEDFAGHKGEIRAGGLQWMTAGRGIVHSEMPNPRMHGLQLWVNLKSSDKMVPPAYQELNQEHIPTKEENGVKVVVIAGESMGISSPVRTRTPVYYLDFTLKPNSKFTQNIPSDWNCLAYTLSGTICFGATEVDSHYTVVFDKGTTVEFENKSTKDSRLILLAGQPIGEPVVQHGPFVMNTQDEISKTFEDYQFHKNGFENVATWRSSIGR